MTTKGAIVWDNKCGERVERLFTLQEVEESRSKGMGP